MLNPAEIFKFLLKTDIYKTRKKYNANDLISLVLLDDLLKPREYFPITSSSISFHSLTAIVNDIILNKRECCIEFGSGISTLVLANLIKKNSLKCELYSIEDNTEWYNIMESYLTRNNLSGNVRLINAPLEKTTLSLKDNKWYSLSALNEKIEKASRFDLVIVDGPAAFEREIRLSRYTAVPYIIDKLAPAYSIYIDDADRKGEKKVIDLWNKKYGMKFRKINNSTAFYTKGSKTNTII